MKNSLLKKLFALTGLLILLSTLITLPGGVQAAGYVPQNSNRKILNFNTNWLFAGDVPGANGQIVALDESGFVPVTLPYFRVHPHKAFPKSSFEVPVSWYRRHFSLPSTYAGRRIYVEFQAVAKVADVYVNGTWLGQHKGAYTPFTFDITSLVTLGGADNVIAVKVDSTTRNDIPPEGGSIDYYVWGGITRDVNLIITDPLHVDWAFITTPSVSVSSATVNARTNVRNDSSTSKSVTVITNIVDATNNVVATGSATATINANSAFEFNYNTSTVTNPNLWSTDTPYLYTVYTQVKDGANFVDEQKVRLGIRSIQFNATDGKFYLNGQWVKLRGLDRHESYPYIGRAAPNRLQAKDADMLKYELGVNMMRMSHYPQDPEFLERADEIGLLVLEEIPGWQFIGNTAWQDISVQNVQEMVMRDRNHPSIIIWGVRINESGDNSTFYTRTNNLARQLDPSRPTGGVRNFTGSQFLEDVYTYNDFSGGAINPTVLPWLITESVGHTHPDRASSPESTLIDTMVTHLNVQNQAAQKTNISGALGWAFADYNTTFTGSNSCDEYTCFHGVYDIFRLPKFSASVFASQRDPTRYGPYISINNYHQSTSGTTVYVASNCNQVELFANGVSQGRISPNAYTSLPHPFFQFNNVTTASGSLKADCWIGSSIAATTTQFTPGTATKLVLTPDDTALVADGADMTRVVVKALDSNNQVVPYNTAKVTFSITGPGAVVGESPLLLEAGRGAVYIKAALGQTGSITLSASASGLTGASTNVTVNSFTTEIVPTSGSYSFGFVNDVNDLDEGTGSNLFNYAGTWSHGSGSGGLFNGDNSWSSTTNDSATLAFNGTRVVLYGVLDTTHGTGAISIDGGAETNVSFNGTRRGNVALWGSPTLTQGAHTLRVRVTGNGPVAIDRAMVVSNPPVIIGPPPSSIISVNDNTLGTGQEQFEYVGTWSYGNQAGAYQGDNHWSNATNAYYQVRFTGAQVRLYAAKDPAHGIIGVSIDGGAESNVDLYASTRADQVLVWTSPVLAAGSHTLKVRVTGNKNASSTNTFAIGDRVDIIPASGPTPTPTPTNTPGPSPTPTSTPTRTNTPAPTPTRTPTPSGVTYYTLIARHSSKCLEVPNSSTADGIQLDQFTCSGGTNQQWQFSPVGSFYNIINRNSGKCMDVNGASTADGAAVIQWTCNTGTNQQWTLSDLGTGYYQLIARHSGKCLDVNAASTADGALMIQWPCGSGTNQQWQRQ